MNVIIIQTQLNFQTDNTGMIIPTNDIDIFVRSCNLLILNSILLLAVFGQHGFKITSKS